MARRPLSSSTGGRLDRAGVWLSGLCLVHCLAGLFLVGLLGIGGGILLDPSIHRFGLAAAVAIGVATLGAAAYSRRRLDLALLGGAGLTLMAGALFVGHGAPEAVLTIAGVSLLATAHIRNLRQPC